MSETDAEFIERVGLEVIKAASLIPEVLPEDWGRLFTIARRGAEAVKMMAEQDYKYNQNTNDLIARHAAKIKQAALWLAQLEAALQYYADTFCEFPNNECCGKLDDDSCSGCKARSALENTNLPK